MTRLTRGVAILWLAVAPAARAAGDFTVYRIKPSETDAAIVRFDLPHYVVFDARASAAADLLVFMSGTGGAPAGASDFLTLAAAQGYRVISLAYNDAPAVVAVCVPNPDPACSAKVREKRIFGNDTTRLIDDSRAEAIVNRLTKLIAALDRDHPSERWGQYLEHGAPNWAHIAVAGHSQGAGMAAFIAQRAVVARVVLFSSPWDNFGPAKQIAPWVAAGPGLTPPERWFAAYHAKENTAALIARAYRALGIPAAHTRVLTLEPSRKAGDNPYHLSMLGNGTTPRRADGAPAYADDWRFLVGPGR